MIVSGPSVDRSCAYANLYTVTLASSSDTPKLHGIRVCNPSRKALRHSLHSLNMSNLFALHLDYVNLCFCTNLLRIKVNRT